MNDLNKALFADLEGARRDLGCTKHHAFHTNP
jgi:hypothetical protein